MKNFSTTQELIRLFRRMAKMVRYEEPNGSNYKREIRDELRKRKVFGF